MRSGRLSARGASRLLIVRTPVVAGMAVLWNGGPWPIVGLVAIGGLAVGLWMEPYLREFMGDAPHQKWTAPPHDIDER